MPCRRPEPPSLSQEAEQHTGIVDDVIIALGGKGGE
jgi:hypothetical protein